MSLSHISLPDYMAAVAQRQRFERMLSDGAPKFSGYGRELFESSFAAKIEKLTGVIERYEAMAGRTSLAPYDFWTNHMKTELITISGGSVITDSSFASGGSCALAEVRDVISIAADQQLFQPIVRPGWNSDSSLLRGNFSLLDAVPA
jgi:hypothetical protein